MSKRVYLFIRADLIDRPENFKDYRAWIDLGTKLFTDDNFFIHTSPNKQDFLEWIHNAAALTTT